MRAAADHRFGGPDTVHVEELPRPSVGPDDVLIPVQASTVSVADHRGRSREVPRGLGLLAAMGIGMFHPERDHDGLAVWGQGFESLQPRPPDQAILRFGERLPSSWCLHPVGGVAADRRCEDPGGLRRP